MDTKAKPRCKSRSVAVYVFVIRNELICLILGNCHMLCYKKLNFLTYKKVQANLKVDILSEQITFT